MPSKIAYGSLMRTVSTIDPSAARWMLDGTGRAQHRGAVEADAQQRVDGDAGRGARGQARAGRHRHQRRPGDGHRAWVRQARPRRGWRRSDVGGARVGYAIDARVGNAPAGSRCVGRRRAAARAADRRSRSASRAAATSRQPAASSAGAGRPRVIHRRVGEHAARAGRPRAAASGRTARRQGSGPRRGGRAVRATERHKPAHERPSDGAPQIHFDAHFDALFEAEVRFMDDPLETTSGDSDSARRARSLRGIRKRDSDCPPRADGRARRPARCTDGIPV